MLGSSDYSDLYTYTVSDKGTIKLPILGEISIQGQTVRDAKKNIQTAIQSIIKDECSIDLRIVGRYFSVIGSTTNGRYPILKEKMNIFQALAMAGDISTFGDRGSIKLLRETPEGVKVSTFDIRSKNIINSEYYYIQPNDVIYIQDVRSQFFSVTNLGTALSTTFSTISFAVLIYNLVKPIKEKQNTSETTP
jgi:polysaccharide export outer membrane protein